MDSEQPFAIVRFMKFDDLRSIGHNIAHSLASGVGLLIGVYEMDVFGEASQNSEGLTVDFLAGKIAKGRASGALVRAVELYRDALPDLCEKHGASPSAFRELSAWYTNDQPQPRFVVTVADQLGRRTVDEYAGWAGNRVKTVDSLGRVRPKKISDVR